MPNCLLSAAGLRRLLLIGAGLVVGAAASAEDPSGFYGEMLLSVRGDQVRGVFSSARGIDLNGGSGPMFSCSFLLQGRLFGDRADIVSWTPGENTVIMGSLTLSSLEIRLRLNSDQPGCGMATGDMTHEDRVLHRDSPGTDWVGVGMVGAKRAVLQATPAQGTRQAPYLVRFDAVAVLQRQAGWARVRFLNSEKPSTGWLRETELTAFTSWPTREDAP